MGKGMKLFIISYACSEMSNNAFESAGCLVCVLGKASGVHSCCSGLANTGFTHCVPGYSLACE